jgi:thiamine-phosphate pyrophosphorylase
VHGPTGPDLPEFLDAVLAGGVDVVQLREKGVEARRELELCEVLARPRPARRAVVGQRPAPTSRVAARPDVLTWGRTTCRSRRDGASSAPTCLIGPLLPRRAAGRRAPPVAPASRYFWRGPAWPTPTKPGRRRRACPSRRAAAGLGTDRPWFAIGGIDAGTSTRCSRRAPPVVVVRVLTEAADPHAAAADLARRLAPRVRREVRLLAVLAALRDRHAAARAVLHTRVYARWRRSR